ncbi:ankyrin repeat domain-containing protein 31-like isoform X2 [Epinephelus fuscoguttatus]|uniref:ankyrin repeat domain-containing protein 31-like isoform X2 n=1 Tax=Epinephelus fuscoguttatus TaxID=293821 RepID=UPI0020D0C8B6|nr:ankyrin repeat domain-containing protein 31-like isoform X2 [Epinephelus fuscoguttatus]
METNRLKPPEQEMSSCNQSAAGHAESSSQSAEKVSQSVKIPNKMQLNKRSGTGETLLHKVCRKKDLTQVKILIQAGISINMQDYAGWTALHEASAVGAKAVVEELLNAGANVDARNYDGVTPLHDAVNSGHYEVVKLLLQHGSNPSDRNHGGLSALDIAEEEDIKALLSLSMSSATHEQPCKASAQYRQPGAQILHLLQPPTTLLISPALTSPSKLRTPSYSPCSRCVANTLRHLLKGQLVSLASCQKNLVEILQKQMHLVEVYVTMKAILSTPPPNHQGITVVRQQPDHFSTPVFTPASSKAREAHRCNKNFQRKESHRPVTQTRLLRSAHPNNAKDLIVPSPPAPLLTQSKRAATHTDVLNKKVSSCQSSAPQPENISEHINFQRRGSNALIQTRAEDNSTHLSELIQRGVLPSGSDLQVVLKGQWHLAHVMNDGLIKDSRGQLYLAPECWLESVLGNNIPVSSTYAWDKVTFRDKPLSHYLLNIEAEETKPQTHHEDNVQHCRASSSQRVLFTDTSTLNCLMKIKIFHLVTDEEVLPNAIMDRYWETLLKKDYSVLRLGVEDF